MIRLYRIANLAHLPKLNVTKITSATQFLNDRNYSSLQPYNCHPKPLTITIPRRFSSTEVVDHTWYFSFWQTLSNSTPVSYIQKALIEVHDFTGVPWWATIVISTILLRSVITLPLTIYQHKITARIEKIGLEMPAIVEELKKEAAIAMKKFKWTEKQTRAVFQHSLKKQWNNRIVRDNCHPAKSFIVLWGQIPLWIFQSVAIRNLVHMLPDPTSIDAKLTYTELTIGGFGWIPNLTEIDSSYILPVTLGIINLAIIEIQGSLRTRPQTRFQRYATNAFRGLSIVMVPVAASVPSALCVYWVTSSAYGLAQNLFLASPVVRRAVGIPQTKSEVPNPYERIWNTLNMRKNQTIVTTATNTNTLSPETGTAQKKLSGKPQNNVKDEKDSTSFKKME